MTKRVAVLGSPGAGKSVLARQLGEILGIEVFHLDAIFWKPGWVDPDRDEFYSQVHDIIARDEWIIDGNDWRTLDPRLELADLIVYLDFHRFRCLYRVCKRRIQYAGRTRPDMAPGCPEKIDVEFVRFIWNFPDHGGDRIITRVNDHSARKEIHYLHNPAEVRTFLQAMRHRSRPEVLAVSQPQPEG